MPPQPVDLDLTESVPYEFRDTCVPRDLPSAVNWPGIRRFRPRTLEACVEVPVGSLFLLWTSPRR